MNLLNPLATASPLIQRHNEISSAAVARQRQRRLERLVSHGLSFLPFLNMLQSLLLPHPTCHRE